MAQFTKYSWSDASAPQLTGAAGSLIAVLDAVLVTGYGSQSAAGWSHPVATSGNIASYKMAGSAPAYGFVLNDNGPNVTSTYKEAWATGYKIVAGVGAPVGSGTGQFPTAAQLLTTGHVVARKSNTADSTVRPWVCFADGRTFYLFMKTGDSTFYYSDFSFGEFYSLGGSSDADRVFIAGRRLENVATITPDNGGLDRHLPNFMSSAHQGLYLADTQSGGTGSVHALQCGDTSKTNTIPGNGTVPLTGNMPTPNAADNSFYVSKMWLTEASTGTANVRGYLRGFYHWCHIAGQTNDGFIFNGSNLLAGRQFMVIYPGSAGGHYTIEISDTLDTN